MAMIRPLASRLLHAAPSARLSITIVLALTASLGLAHLDRDFASLPALIAIFGPLLLAGMWVNVAIQDYLDASGFVDPGVCSGLAGLEAVFRGDSTLEGRRLLSRALRRMLFFVIGLPPLYVAWLWGTQQVYSLIVGHG